MNINDDGPKKFPVPTKARFPIGDFTTEIASFVYTDDKAEALNSFRNKIHPAELVLAKDEEICRALYAVSRKNTDGRPHLDQLKEARFFILAWVRKRENEDVAKTWYPTSSYRLSTSLIPPKN